jgi:hypothetical protein
VSPAIEHYYIERSGTGSCMLVLSVVNKSLSECQRIKS